MDEINLEETNRILSFSYFNIGGYIGLFIGYTVAQAPELIIGFLRWIKDTLRLSDRTRYAIQ